MKIFTRILNLPQLVVKECGDILVNNFFWFFIASFFIDQIANYFFPFPFFVISAIIVLPFLVFAAQFENPQKEQLFILIFSFLIVGILNSIVYVFGTKNISDLLFIILFISSYFYYRNNIGKLKIFNVSLFFAISLFLFSFTFISIDSQSIGKNSIGTSSFSKVGGIPSEKKIGQVKKVEKKRRIKKANKFKWEPNQLDILEHLRIYHNGLFRISHVASYFFGFLALFFAYQYQKRRKHLHLILLIISFAVCVYSGSRTVLVAFFLSIIIFLFRKRYIIYLQGVIIIVLLMILGRQYLVQLSDNTILFQYFTFIQTTFENFTRLSRFRLWYSWWIEVRDFGFWDFMIGKSYTNALLANSKNLHYNVWFHNDFLNIFYTYGAWCTILYIWFFVKIYRDNKIYINQNIFISIFFSSMVLTALINGFYYYFPVFLLYLFFLLIKNEKQKSIQSII